MDLQWWNELKVLLKNIWSFITHEEQKRLEALQKQAEKGSDELRKQLYDEIHKIHKEQNRGFTQKSPSSNMNSEQNQFRNNSLSTTAICHPTPSPLLYAPAQNSSECFKHSKMPKKQSLSKADIAYKNALTFEDTLRAELVTPTTQNFALQQKLPMQAAYLLSQSRPQEDNMETEEINEYSQKFAREQEILRTKNEKELAQKQAEFKMDLLRAEQKFREELAAKACPTIISQLPFSSKNQPLEALPLPVLKSNLTNFADDLKAISNKYQKLDSLKSPNYPFLIPPKSTSSQTMKSFEPKNNTLKKNYSAEKMEIEVNRSEKVMERLPVIPKNNKVNIGIMGLIEAGKSYLISALTQSSIKNLDNTKCIDYGQNCTFFEIDHPNYGFVSNQPEAIKAKCQKYFDQIQINNLICLLNVINGDLREEDIFATQLALQAGIQVIIIRSKSDEWLDGSYRNNITDGNKKAFSEKDKQYVKETANKIDEAVVACPIFNISALSLYNISTKTKRATVMQKYLIDELALIHYLENFGLCFDSLKYCFLEAGKKEDRSRGAKNEKPASKYLLNEKQNEKVDILFLGRIGSGKSAIIDGLRGIKGSDENSATKSKSCTIQNLKVAEFTYQEPTTFSKIIEHLKQDNLHQLKRIYLVIGDAVGELDAKLVKFIVDEKLPMTILLTKTDLHIDSITERRGFEQHDLDEYYNQRKHSTQHEIGKVVKNADKLEIFVISSIVIRNLITNTNKFLQYACDDSSFLSNWTEKF